MDEAKGKGKPQGEGKGKPEGKGKRFVALALAIVAGIVASVGLLAVISAGFALSFDAISAVGFAAHISAGKAWMLPVSIDGAMLVASVHFVIARRAGGKGWYPLIVVVTGTLISVACNGLHATGEAGLALDLGGTERFWVSTVPALMLALSVHMLVELLVQVMGSPAHATHATDATPAAQAESVAAAPAPPVVVAPPAPLPPVVVAPPSLPSGDEGGARRDEARAIAAKASEGKPAPRATVAARAPRATVTAKASAPAPTDELASKRGEHDLDIVRALAAEQGKVPSRVDVKAAIRAGADRADVAIRSLRAEIDAGVFDLTATSRETAQ